MVCTHRVKSMISMDGWNISLFRAVHIIVLRNLTILVMCTVKFHNRIAWRHSRRDTCYTFSTFLSPVFVTSRGDNRCYVKVRTRCEALVIRNTTKRNATTTSIYTYKIHTGTDEDERERERERERESEREKVREKNVKKLIEMLLYIY
jgi:hypothetical protein